MRIHQFQFGAFRNLLQPRKPRHPLARIALGVAGVLVLALLLVVGLVVGTAMVLGGLAFKLLAARKAPASARTGAARDDAGYVDAEYRVVRKPALPQTR